MRCSRDQRDEIDGEVSDNSLRADRTMAAVYGRAGIPGQLDCELGRAQVEVYTAPSLTGYPSRVDYTSGMSAQVVIAGTVVGHIAVNDILV